MCQVVAYRRFKTVENSKTVSRKSDHGRLLEVVVYERFQYKAFTENIFSFFKFLHSFHIHSLRKLTWKTSAQLQ